MPTTHLPGATAVLPFIRADSAAANCPRYPSRITRWRRAHSHGCWTLRPPIAAPGGGKSSLYTMFLVGTMGGDTAAS